MAGYQELIKNLDNLRNYMRNFFVYGFMTRNDFTQKSSRTYDNERRRIENYLNQYIKWDYNKTGKKVFVSVDASKITTNPFYQAYLCKSFTNNDIMLHFFLQDLLANNQPLKVEQITDLLLENYQMVFDIQTVRAKLNEYHKLGILAQQKHGRAHLYSLNQHYLQQLIQTNHNLRPLLNFFSQVAPFGVVGHYLQNRQNQTSDNFIFKHRFIMHTLDDIVLLTIIQAIKEQKSIQITSFSPKTNITSNIQGIPIKILKSTQTGRQYLFLFTTSTKNPSTYRLDHIKSVKLGQTVENISKIQAKAQQSLGFAWGSIVRSTNRLETLEMTLYIDEQTELYVLHRLEREKRHGKIEKISPNHFCYTIKTYDAGELMAWVKSYIGRIVSIKSTNSAAKIFYQDVKRLQQMYGEENNGTI